ncbi:MAG: response regulator [Bacteroidetes bacterium]|nr:response regulator [Bacteroidota bacterium]
MTSKRFIYYILLAFIIGNLLLIYIQYNSTKNIGGLVSGNEKTLNEFQVERQLRDLRREVAAYETSIKSIIDDKDSENVETVKRNIAEIENGLTSLQKINDDDSSVKFIDQLQVLVQEKINVSNAVLDTFHNKGKTAAGLLMAGSREKMLTDSITLITHKIDSSRQYLLSKVTAAIDENGRKARKWGIILILLILIAGAGLFWYIVEKIKQQQELITQLNESEKKVKEVVQLKENFMANMSHEIRTPMNAILGFTNLLQRKNLDSESKQYISSIQVSGENLLTIINDILDMSKIEAGMMRIESTPFSLKELLHSVETMFLKKAKDKGVLLTSVINEDVPDLLEGDAVRLTQIVVNLIGNAIKFTDKGSVKIKVSNKEIDNKIARISFEIKDTGIGIEKEKLPGIFERFRQAEDSITRKYGGTGLGLSIVKDLVNLQGGEITVESELNKGTIFRFAISYRISDQPTRTPVVPDDELNGRNSFNAIRILVVEDNKINQTLMQHLLTSWNINFDIAENGKDAISNLVTKDYDLILMDIQMPVMDGYTTTQYIRHELNDSIPIIAMTAHALTGEREKCIKWGMDEYISKPIKEQELYKLIGHFAKANRKEKIKENKTPAYKHIHLEYMREISGGNKGYERTVTAQFIEIMPGELEKLRAAFVKKEHEELKKTAHSMKTTVSVMGLTEQLQPMLDSLEYDNYDENKIRKNINSINAICTAAIEEAQALYIVLQV